VIEVCKSERRTRTWRVVIEGETTFGLSSDVKIRAKYDVRVFVECQNTGRIRRSDFFRMSDYGRIRRSDFRRTSTYGQNTAFGFMSDSQNTDLIRRSDTRRIQNTMPEDAEQEARHRSSVPQPATTALECPPLGLSSPKTRAASHPHFSCVADIETGTQGQVSSSYRKKLYFFAISRADSTARLAGEEGDNGTVGARPTELSFLKRTMPQPIMPLTLSS